MRIVLVFAILVFVGCSAPTSNNYDNLPKESVKKTIQCDNFYGPYIDDFPVPFDVDYANNQTIILCEVRLEGIRYSKPVNESMGYIVDGEPFVFTWGDLGYDIHAEPDKNDSLMVYIDLDTCYTVNVEVEVER